MVEINDISSRTPLDGELLISVNNKITELKDEFSGDQEVVSFLEKVEFLTRREITILDFADFINEFVDNILSEDFQHALKKAVKDCRFKVVRQILKQRKLEKRKYSWHTAFFHYPDPGAGITGGTNSPHVARINFQNRTNENVDPAFYARNELFKNKTVILRIHSACFLSETLWHSDCDCCEQLNGTRDYIEKTGDGIILYLWQEGRGAGLGNKAKALSLTKGEESLTADDALDQVVGKRDLREYGFVPSILRGLGVDETTLIKLVSDNKDKYEALVNAGFNVEQISAVGIASNLQAALEIAEKALSGKYETSVFLNSKSLDWIKMEVQKLVKREPSTRLFLNWVEKVSQNSSLDKIPSLRQTLAPILGVN